MFNSSKKQISVAHKSTSKPVCSPALRLKEWEETVKLSLQLESKEVKNNQFLTHPNQLFQHQRMNAELHYTNMMASPDGKLPSLVNVTGLIKISWLKEPLTMTSHLSKSKVPDVSLQLISTISKEDGPLNSQKEPTI